MKKCEHNNPADICDYCHTGTSSTDLLVYRVYTLDGISVTVKIDFMKKQISLVDRDLKRKNWLFAERELEYMRGWLNILDAMKHAITEARKELQKRSDEDTEDLMKLLVATDLRKVKNER